MERDSRQKEEEEVRSKKKTELCTVMLTARNHPLWRNERIANGITIFTKKNGTKNVDIKNATMINRYRNKTNLNPCRIFLKLMSY